MKTAKFFLLGLAAVLPMALIAAQPEETEAFRPNPVIQQCLKSFVAEDPEERMALFSEEERGACSTEEEWDGLLGRKIAWLAEQAGGSEALVGELLFLASRANDVPEGMLPYVFISRWDISPDVLADALRPYLATDDKRMAAEAAELLEAVETLKQNGIEAGSISVGTAQDPHAGNTGTGGEI